MPLNSRAVATHLRAYARSVDLGAQTCSLDAPADSPQARIRLTTDPDELFLVGLYDRALGRLPDAAGLAAHLGALRAGTSREDVIAGVTESLEAQQPMDRRLREDPRRLVAYGAAIVVGVTPTDAQLDRMVTRLSTGVPISVLIHELDPTGAEAWQSVLVRHLLAGLPAAADLSIVDRVLAKVGAFEDPEAVLALVLPGRSPLTRLRRYRRAARATSYATLELAAAARTSGPVVAVPTSAGPASGVGAEFDQLVRQVTALEWALSSGERGAQVRVVEVDSMLMGVPVDEWRLAAFLEYRGHPEPGLGARMLPRLATGHTFVDVGANIGLYSVAAAQAVGPTGHVVAVEPTPRTAAVLRQNIQLNGLLESHDITVHECAVGAETGSASLALHASDSGHNSLFADSDTTGAVVVDVVPLDDLVPAGARVDIVKIDVEGAELAVLEGMRRIAEENPSVVVFAELADEHLRRAGTSAAGLLAEAERLGWVPEVFETVSGEGAALVTAGGLPLTVCLVRRDPGSS